MNRLTKWNDRTEQVQLKDWDSDYWKDFMTSLDTVEWLEIYGAIVKLAEYEDLEERGDLKKVVRAKWEYFGVHQLRCSNCHSTYAMQYKTNYCPHCGSKMYDRLNRT